MGLPRRTGWLGWILAFVLLAAIASLWLGDLFSVRQPTVLALASDAAFPIVVSGFAASLLARSFLICGATGFLVLGYGVVIWGLVGMTTTMAAPNNIPLGGIIYYGLVWLSALCHLVGALLLLRTRQAVSARALWLAAAYTLAAATVAFVTLLARTDWMPSLFVAGQDAASLQEPELISAIAMFVLAAVLLGAGVAKDSLASPLAYWYGLALGLIAVGLFGAMFHSSLAVPNGTDRSSLSLGSFYMLLIAVVASQRKSRIRELSAEAARLETEDLYRLLFMNMNEGFFIGEVLCDENGKPCNYRHLALNPAYEANTGLKKEQVLGRTATEVFLPSPTPLATERFCEAGLLGKSSHFEIYSQAMRKHLDLHAFPCGKGRFGVIFMDISERKQMEQAMQDLNATLESKVAERTAELKRRTEQLQQLALQLSLAEDLERKRIGAFLHEDLQQQIVGAKFHLSLLRKQTKDNPEQTDLIAKIEAMLKEAIDKSRSLSHELSPAVLSQNDLGEALRWLADRMGAKQGLQVRVDVRNERPLQSDAITIFLFRAVQEMLFNVVKHAGVGDATIRMSRHRRYICVSVSDRGKGFAPEDRREAIGFGLLNIRERIELLGGRMKVKSRPNAGSTLSIIVPDEIARTLAQSAPEIEASRNPAT